MKKLALVAVVMAGVGVSGMANAAIDPATEANLVRICKALKSDSKIRLHQAIKRSRLNYKQVAKGLKCNGQDPFTFAMAHKADTTANLFARRANLDVDGLLAKR